VEEEEEVVEEEEEWWLPRVAKTCQPCQPVGANFSRPVLIFGQGTLKNCL